MHPNRAFRGKDRSLANAMIDQIGFGMVFCQTPDGPRVAHSPLLSAGNGKIQFHLARGNATAKHLSNEKALIVINGPDGYVSARWYSDPDQVPTWNYIAIELEGPVRILERDRLVALLERLTARQEAQIRGGTPWTMDKLSDANRERMLRSIIGFEMTVEDVRDTIKLSQNKSDNERARLIEGFLGQGSSEMADAMKEMST